MQSEAAPSLSMPIISKYSEELLMNSLQNENSFSDGCMVLDATPDLYIAECDTYIPTPTPTPPSQFHSDRKATKHIVKSHETKNFLQPSISVPEQVCLDASNNDDTSSKINDDATLYKYSSAMGDNLSAIATEWLNNENKLSTEETYIQPGLKCNSLPNLTSVYSPNHEMNNFVYLLKRTEPDVTNRVFRSLNKTLDSEKLQELIQSNNYQPQQSIALTQPPIPKRRLYSHKQNDISINSIDPPIEEYYRPKASDRQSKMNIEAGPEHILLNSFINHENKVSSPSSPAMQYISNSDALYTFPEDDLSRENKLSVPVPKSRSRNSLQDQQEVSQVRESSILIPNRDMLLAKPPTPPLRISSLRQILIVKPTPKLTENQSTSTSELETEFKDNSVLLLKQQCNTYVKDSLTSNLTTSFSYPKYTPAIINAPVPNTFSPINNLFSKNTNNKPTYSVFPSNSNVNNNNNANIFKSDSTFPNVLATSKSVSNTAHVMSTITSYTDSNSNSYTDSREVITDGDTAMEQVIIGDGALMSSSDKIDVNEVFETNCVSGSALLLLHPDIESTPIHVAFEANALSLTYSSNNDNMIITGDNINELPTDESPSPPCSTPPPPVPCSTPPELEQDELNFSEITQSQLQQNISKLDEVVISSLTDALNTIDNRNVSPIRNSSLSHFRAKISSLVHSMQQDIYTLTNMNVHVDKLKCTSLSDSLTNSLTKFAHDTEKLAYSHFCTIEQRRELLLTAKEIAQTIRIQFVSLQSECISEPLVVDFFSQIQKYTESLMRI